MSMFGEKLAVSETLGDKECCQECSDSSSGATFKVSSLGSGFEVTRNPTPAEMEEFFTGDDAMNWNAYHRTNERDEMILDLREQYPHGHQRFIPISLEEMELHSKKNHDYAAGGNPLGNFERVSFILSLYPDLSLGDPSVVAMVYLMKQLDAVLWMKSNGYVAKVEGIDGRLADISVYAKIVRCMEQDDALANAWTEEDIDKALDKLREQGL